MQDRAGLFTLCGCNRGGRLTSNEMKEIIRVTLEMADAYGRLEVLFQTLVPRMRVLTAVRNLNASGKLNLSESLDFRLRKKNCMLRTRKKKGAKPPKRRHFQGGRAKPRGWSPFVFPRTSSNLFNSCTYLSPEHMTVCGYMGCLEVPFTTCGNVGNFS